MAVPRSIREDTTGRGDCSIGASIQGCIADRIALLA
jgi:hypothetical protein